MAIHAEIQYDAKDGPVHSDICPPDCKFTNDDDYRKFLHDCLDEWINWSSGTGFFYIGNGKSLADNFTEDN